MPGVHRKRAIITATASLSTAFKWMSEREWEDEKKVMTYALVFDGWQIITHSHNNISKQIKSKLKIWNVLEIVSERMKILEYT